MIASPLTSPDCRVKDARNLYLITVDSRSRRGDAGTIYDFPLPPIHIQITPIILSQQHTTLAADAAGITSLTTTLIFNAFAPCPDKAANGKVPFWTNILIDSGLCKNQWGCNFYSAGLSRWRVSSRIKLKQKYDFLWPQFCDSCLSTQQIIRNVSSDLILTGVKIRIVMPPSPVQLLRYTTHTQTSIIKLFPNARTMKCFCLMLE